MVAILGSAGGGRFTPDKPTVTHHTAKGQFVISNYDSSLTYNISVTAGTVTRSGNIITLSNANAIATISSVSPKGASSSGNATAEVKAYTYYTVHYNRAQCGPGPNCSAAACGESGWGEHWDTSPEGWSINPHCSKNESFKNSTPSGYTDSYGEWWKVA